jgi:hypothetical protein
MKKVECPRCGGSGKTEHTHIVYGVCFLCKGNGIVNEKTLLVSQKRKENKAKKEAEIKKQNDLIDKITWEQNHKSAQAEFEKLVIVNKFDILTIDAFDTCVRIFNHIGKPFTKELFEDILDNYGRKFYISHNDYRFSLVKYFRANGVFDSKFEYQHNSYDYNEFRP